MARGKGSQFHTEVSATDTGSAVIKKHARDVENSAKKAGKSLKWYEKQANKLSKDFVNNMKKMGGAIAGAFAISSIRSFGQESLRLFHEQESVLRNLEFQYARVQGASEGSFERIVQLSKQIQDLTGFGDEVTQRIAKNLAVFGLAADEIETLLPLLADMASRMNGDVAQAGQELISMLGGATETADRYGVSIRGLNTISARLDAIIVGLTENFKGASTEMANTATVIDRKLKASMSDLKEIFGGAVAESKEYQKVLLFMQKISESAEGKQSKLSAAIDKVAGAFKFGVPGIGLFLSAYQDADEAWRDLSFVKPYTQAMDEMKEGHEGVADGIDAEVEARRRRLELFKQQAEFERRKKIGEDQAEKLRREIEAERLRGVSLAPGYSGLHGSEQASIFQQNIDSQQEWLDASVDFNKDYLALVDERIEADLKHQEMLRLAAELRENHMRAELAKFGEYTQVADSLAGFLGTVLKEEEAAIQISAALKGAYQIAEGIVEALWGSKARAAMHFIAAAQYFFTAGTGPKGPAASFAGGGGSGSGGTSTFNPLQAPSGFQGGGQTNVNVTLSGSLDQDGNLTGFVERTVVNNVNSGRSIGKAVKRNRGF